MPNSKQILLLSVTVAVVLAMFFVVGSSAQEPAKEGEVSTADNTTADADIMLRVHRQNIDPYWQDAKLWAFYGYRPHIKANYSSFTSLPSYGSGSRTGYSYGVTPNLPTGDMSIFDQEGKIKIQMSKYGTWH